MKMRFDLSGTQDGTIRMRGGDRLDRLAQAQQQLKGEIKVGDSAQGPPMMAIPVVFDTKVKMEMSDKPLEPPPSRIGGTALAASACRAFSLPIFCKIVDCMPGRAYSQGVRTTFVAWGRR